MQWQRIARGHTCVPVHATIQRLCGAVLVVSVTVDLEVDGWLLVRASSARVPFIWQAFGTVKRCHLFWSFTEQIKTGSDELLGVSQLNETTAEFFHSFTWHYCSLARERLSSCCSILRPFEPARVWNGYNQMSTRDSRQASSSVRAEASVCCKNFALWMFWTMGIPRIGLRELADGR